MGYHLKKNSNYEVRIYIGNRIGYRGREFSLEELKQSVGEYQKKEESNPVRITPTTFVWGEYQENGWEISIINYPRCTKLNHKLKEFGYGLADYLFNKFPQNRMSIVFPDEIVMLEADDAEAK